MWRRLADEGLADLAPGGQEWLRPVHEIHPRRGRCAGCPGHDPSIRRTVPRGNAPRAGPGDRPDAWRASSGAGWAATSATGPHRASGSVPQDPRTYLAASGWSGRSPVYRPVSVVLSGDSTLGLTSMRWTSWGADHAQGTGLGWVDACTLSCATGPIDTEPVRVALSGRGRTCGREFFTRLVLTWTGRVPAGMARTTVWKAGTPAC